MKHRRRRSHVPISLLALLASALLWSCSGERPAELSADAVQLRPCPSSPNCVSTEASDGEHTVAPFLLVGTRPQAWQSVREAVAELPGSQIVTTTESYLHAECTSRLFGFVDDLEIRLQDAQLAVRSASRVGHSDLGVNRQRVEELRSVLQERGVVAKRSQQ